MNDADAVLLETLHALDMPPEAVPGWLALLERFYRKHGGERRYAECLALIAECEELIAPSATLSGGK
jgi:hypothetical protein